MKVQLFSTLSSLLLFSPHSRVGQRGAGLSATIARSEHEISEIIDGLSEQEVRLLSVLCCSRTANNSISFYWQWKVSFRGFIFFIRANFEGWFERIYGKFGLKQVL